MTKTMLLINKEEANSLLDEQIAKGRELGKTLFNDHRTLIYLSHVAVEPEMDKWTARNIALMQRLFNTDEHVVRFQKFKNKLIAKMERKEKTDHLLGLIGEQLTELEAVKECLDLYTVKTETTEPAKTTSASPLQPARSARTSRRVGEGAARVGLLPPRLRRQPAPGLRPLQAGEASV